VIQWLPVVIGPTDTAPLWGASATGHPMREVTRAVAFDPDGWTPERQSQVIALFDGLASEWNDRDVPERKLPILDALDRGLAAAPGVSCDVAIELGGGTGVNLPAIEGRFATLVTLDISAEMLRLAPPRVARVQGDGSKLPLPDGRVDALILINMFLFPTEVDRVLAPAGVVVWVNSRGVETPIHLTADEVDEALPGAWSGVASAAGSGTWSVHWRDRPT